MKLIGITDDRHSVDELLLKLQQTEPYINAFILREKSKSDEQLETLIFRLTASGFPPDKLIMHARPGLAESLSISCQLTGFGMSANDVRAAFPSLKFGCSVHSLEEARKARAAGADWLLYGHIYPTASKKNLTPRGTDELFKIAASFPVPVYAIGGIQPVHLPFLREHGVCGAAILSPLSNPDAVDTVKMYVHARDL